MSDNLNVAPDDQALHQTIVKDISSEVAQKMSPIIESVSAIAEVVKSQSEDMKNMCDSIKSLSDIIAEEKKSNIHMHDGISEEQFIEMCTKRDVTLEMPVLILPAIQVDIRAGEFPPAASNGISYLKIPVNAV